MSSFNERYGGISLIDCEAVLSMKKAKKKKVPKRAHSDQKEWTDLVRSVYEANGIAISNMRGKHFKFDRIKLRDAILKIYEESLSIDPGPFHRDNGDFVMNRLLLEVVDRFDKGTLKRCDFSASNEKAIKEEIKYLQKTKKIRFNLYKFD